MTIAQGSPLRGLAGLQHVAEASLGLDERFGGVRVDLATQVRDVTLDDARVAVEVVLPDVVEDLSLRQHAVGVEHQVAQQLELGGAEVDRDLADLDVVRVLVHRQLAGADHGLFVGLHGAAEDGLDARDDLVEAERLGDVVVTAGVQTLDLVFGLVLGGQEQNGGGVAGASQALGDAEPVHIGQHDVEHDQIGLFFENGRDRLSPVRDGPDLKAGEAQARDQEIADVRLIVYDEDARCSHYPIIPTGAMHPLNPALIGAFGARGGRRRLRRGRRFGEGRRDRMLWLRRRPDLRRSPGSARVGAFDRTYAAMAVPSRIVYA
ncbi:Transcriptional regulator (modular protein) [Microbacterium sp. C448]|nr:Transcriptional regulator (modular protein) [Microbacterium sp. C448]